MTVIAGAAVIVCVITTNPGKVGPLGVTLWFVALLVVLQGVVSLGLVEIKKRYFAILGEHKIVTSSWRQGLLLGGGIVMLLALSSLRQLGWRDVALLSVLLGLIEFYFRAKA